MVIPIFFYSILHILGIQKIISSFFTMFSQQFIADIKIYYYITIHNNCSEQRMPDFYRYFLIDQLINKVTNFMRPWFLANKFCFLLG